LNTENIVKSLRQTVPLSKTMNEEIDHLRSWAQGRARWGTSQEIGMETVSDKRKLEL
jgi:hypothetical protein